MASRRQRQLAARKQPSSWQQDLARKKVFHKIDKQTQNTENLIARLRARLEVLDLVVDRSLPEDAFLAKKEMHPWLFRKNKRLDTKWTFVNKMVTMQEFLVAASDARKRKDEAQAKSFHSDSQKTILMPVKNTSSCETSSITNTPSKSRRETHKAEAKDSLQNAVVSNERFPKETIPIMIQYRNNQEARPETSNKSFPKDKIPDVCRCSRTENYDTVLQATMIDDSIVAADSNGNIVPEPSNKHLLASTTTPLVNGVSSLNLEFLKLDKLSRNERKLHLRPSLKPADLSKFRTMARDLEKTLRFEWSPESVSKICQYCSKSVCVGQRFNMYLAVKGSRDTQASQSKPSDRIKRRIADVTAIYALAYH